MLYCITLTWSLMPSTFFKYYVPLTFSPGYHAKSKKRCVEVSPGLLSMEQYCQGKGGHSEG